MSASYIINISEGVQCQRGTLLILMRVCGVDEANQ